MSAATVFVAALSLVCRPGWAQAPVPTHSASQAQPDGEAQLPMADEPLPTRASQILSEQLQRNQAQLSLPDAPPLYHMRYHLSMLHQSQAQASFGSLVQHEDSPLNILGVELRVGGPSLDNTGFAGWDPGFQRQVLPDQLEARGLHQACWQLTDLAYKGAVEQLARKQAAFTPPPDYPGDYLTGLRHESWTPQRSPQPADLGRLVRDLSAEFPRDGSLELGTALAAREHGQILMIDSEGSVALRPQGELVLRVMGHLRAADGMLLTDHRTWIVSGPQHLPAPDELRSAVRQLTAELVATGQAQPLQEEYVGPVIFEEQAAVDLFQLLLVPQLEGTPPPIPYDTRYGAMGAEEGPASSARLGRRVLPPGWSAQDDPQLRPEHPASFDYDMEGTPAERVELADDGIVRQVLMSRVPRKGALKSNGHARGATGARPAGRAAMLQVEPQRRHSRKRLLRRALALAEAYGSDHVMVVRRLQDETVRGENPDAGAFSDEAQVLLPLEIWRCYADGRRERLRGAVFAGVERWVLRAIQAAGPQVEGTRLASFEPGGRVYSPIVGMPTWFSVPEVLVEELELVPFTADPRDKPALPAPQQQEPAGS